MSSDHTNHVLDAIDHATRDWETSRDAMRWTPAEDDDQPPALIHSTIDERAARAGAAMLADLEQTQADAMRFATGGPLPPGVGATADMPPWMMRCLFSAHAISPRDILRSLGTGGA